jgi:hypothetical protein
MPRAPAHRCWIVAYYACWMLAAGGACGLAAVIVWSACGPRFIDDDAGLFGIPVGVVLGFVAARKTVRHRGAHRALVIAGALAAVAGSAGAVSMFGASRTGGEGPFAGLGEVLAGLLFGCVAAIGVVCLAAGTTGRLVARTAGQG